MNINQLHNKLVKQANITKVAGPRANDLRRAIVAFNQVRNDPKALQGLRKLNDVTGYKHHELNLLSDIYNYPNSCLDPKDVLHYLKKPPYRLYDDISHNKFIDRIGRMIESKYDHMADIAKEKGLQGLDFWSQFNGKKSEFNQKLINRYILEPRRRTFMEKLKEKLRASIPSWEDISDFITGDDFWKNYHRRYYD